jgi:alkylhydroperoxidase family enzyme
MIKTLDVDPDAMRVIVTDPRAGALDETERAIMDLADRVALDATSVTHADVDRLRALGLTDGDILDVILAATARCFFSKTLDAAGVEADAEYATLEPGLRDALVVGRPIETAARP